MKVTPWEMAMIATVALKGAREAAEAESMAVVQNIVTSAYSASKKSAKMELNLPQ